VRIDRFQPEVDVIRGYGYRHRRITMRGNDGSLHPFVVQNPSQRHCRREERVIQLFRIMNRSVEMFFSSFS
jgi:transformation/transcription domain-associated protein